MATPPDDLWPLAQMALDCVHRPYPNIVHHTLVEDEDARPPRELTPAFYGCYDWHSAVHGHWLIARVLRVGSQERDARVTEARAALAQSLTAKHLEAELAYLRAPGRAGFERPYGLAWLLALHAECFEWAQAGDADAAAWSDRLLPLVDLAVERLQAWFDTLAAPVRSGEHSQSAFAMGLVLDWAASVARVDVERAVSARARELHEHDRDWSFAFEPGGQDFLSPGLGVADLMRRVLDPKPFFDWLRAFWPALPTVELTPTRSSDPTDGKHAHLDGLSASRAWMLEGIGSALEDVPGAREHRKALEESAQAHRTVALAALEGRHYAGTHWLGTFAAYLLTRRGLRQV